ncbi:hypothetical protein GLOIN_2v1627879, partial [Rhizophagus irregularis DAOM 181602=DAOM 197198]
MIFRCEFFIFFVFYFYYFFFLKKNILTIFTLISWFNRINLFWFVYSIIIFRKISLLM